MANLMERAAELRSQGHTERRVFRALSHEFPHSERDLRVRAARLPGAPTGYLPSWAQRIDAKGAIQPNGGILRPVIAKRPPGAK